VVDFPALGRAASVVEPTTTFLLRTRGDRRFRARFAASSADIRADDGGEGLLCRRPISRGNPRRLGRYSKSARPPGVRLSTWAGEIIFKGKWLLFCVTAGGESDGRCEETHGDLFRPTGGGTRRPLRRDKINLLSRARRPKENAKRLNSAVVGDWASRSEHRGHKGGRVPSCGACTIAAAPVEIRP